MTTTWNTLVAPTICVGWHQRWNMLDQQIVGATSLNALKMDWVS